VFCWLCPSPSQVHHHSACQAMYLLHSPRLLHPADGRTLQDRSHCL
jgi:hypothetical protein